MGLKSPGHHGAGKSLQLSNVNGRGDQEFTELYKITLQDSLVVLLASLLLYYLHFGMIQGRLSPKMPLAGSLVLLLLGSIASSLLFSPSAYL